MAKRLTLNDMSKKDLVDCIEKMSLVKDFFSEEIIAQFVIARKYEELHRLQKRIKTMNDTAAKTRSGKKKDHILRTVFPLIKRFDKRINEVADLQKRFPQEDEEEKNA